jgi:acylphosphatase
MMAKARLHVVIEGRVQGVFFRASTREEACSLGLSGWVKNCWDGRVDAVFEGERDNVEKILAWCHKGPPGAMVRNVEVNWEEATGEFDSFSIKH